VKHAAPRGLHAVPQLWMVAGQNMQEDAMAKYKLIALTKPLEGREDAYNEWYQNTHLQQLTAIPGVVSAQRYQQVVKLVGENSNPYLAIYDIECDDPMAFLGALGQAAAAGDVTQGDDSDAATTYTALFTEFGAPVFPK
jgi:hypothetical protein